MGAVTLEDLITSLKTSIINASKVLETSNLNTIQNYFNDDGTPKTMPIKIGDKTSDVPIYTLLNQQNLNISELEISFQTKLFGERTSSVDTTGSISGSAANNIYCDIHDPNKSQDGGYANIKMTFKMGDKPEAVSRINDQLIQKYNL